MKPNQMIKEQYYTVTVHQYNSYYSKWEQKTFTGQFKGFLYDEEGNGLYFFWVDGETRGKEYTEEDFITIESL